jgi:micrococcal nuclease
MARGARWVLALGLLLMTLWSGVTRQANGEAAAAACQAFPETGKQVCDPFLTYWQEHGGLAQQGYPISDAFMETNPTDGKQYRTQYFERARFEYHPEIADPQYQVLLGLLGGEQYRAKYPAAPPPPFPGDPFNNPAYPQECADFAQTGQRVCSLFLAYWRANGGLAQQGLPLTGVIFEANPTDGKTYPTQYFERARFEYHEEIADPQYKVLLGLLGREQFQAKYPNGVPTAGGASPAPSAPPAPSTAPGRETATVTEVIDGDTIRVRLAGGAIETVRYIGVDTPETREPGTPVQCYGPEATARNTALVEGQAIELERDRTERDRYGRLLRYVFAAGTHVNEALVREGFARSNAYPPDTTYQATFDAAQAEARAAGRGQWGACAAPAPSASPPSAAPRPTPSPPPPAPQPAPSTDPRAGCDPSYPTICLAPPPPDLDCKDIPCKNFPGPQARHAPLR